MAESTRRRDRWFTWGVGLPVLLVFLWFWLLPAAGRFLVNDLSPRPAGAVVVLNTGVEYIPRLVEAAALVREGYATTIVINGNRKSETQKRLEAAGFEPAAPWDEDGLRILELLGVTRQQVITVSLEDAYDTLSEARGLVPVLLDRQIHSILLVTSKYHTRRAGFIWQQQFGDHIQVSPVAAREDPYDAQGWWREGRQVRWLLNEYGGWLFYFWQALIPGDRTASSQPEPG